MSGYHNFHASIVSKIVVDEMTWAVSMLATALQRQLKTVINKEGTGKKWSGLPKRSSSPGFPPVVQTGTLLRSWTTKALPMGGKRKALFLGSPLNYAKFLETGTKNKDGSPRMLPRPYIDLSIKNTEEDRRKIVAKVQKRIEKKLMQASPSFPKKVVP